MRGCHVCERQGHRSHDSHLPEVLLCPEAIAMKRDRTRRAMYVYRRTLRGMLTDERRLAARRGTA